MSARIALLLGVAVALIAAPSCSFMELDTWDTDSGIPAPDGQDASALDAALSLDAAQVDAGASGVDASEMGVDAAPVEADAANANGADGSALANADAGLEELDGSRPASDASAEDASSAGSDAAQPHTDASAPGADASLGEPDAAFAEDAACAADTTSDPLNCGGCGLACGAPDGGTPLCGGGKCGFSVSASNLAGFWSVASGGAPQLALTDDGQAVLSPLDFSAVDTLVDLSSHTTQATSGTGGRRQTLAIEVGGSRQYKVGWSTHAYVMGFDGSIVYDKSTFCNNAFSEWFAIDPLQMLAYMIGGWPTYQGVGDLTILDLKTGDITTQKASSSAGRQAFTFIADAQTLYAADNAGWVAQIDLGGKSTTWSTVVENWNASILAAVGPAASGGKPPLAVTLAPGSTALPGRVALVLADGTVAWKKSGYLVMRNPVWSGSGDVIVGTWALNQNPGGVVMLSHIDGSVVWNSPMPGDVRDLVVGDGGLVWALVAIASTSEMRVAGLDASTGAVRYWFRDLVGGPSDGEMALRNGTLYVLAGGALQALPVASTGYDPASAWPARMHDNQRTANAAAPLNR